MTESEKSTIMLMCGALQGVEENTNEVVTQTYLLEIRTQLEALVNKSVNEKKDY